jgi:hypothetical protein
MVITIVGLLLLANKRWRAGALRIARAALRRALSGLSALGACLSGTVALPQASPDALMIGEYGS